jgi:PPP family 3-phenylpropionic acid transporter
MIASISSFPVRMALFFGAYFFATGVQVPYLPLWLDGRGLTAAEISLVAAAPLVLRIFIPPTVAFFADRAGRHRDTIMVLSWAGLLALLLLSQAHGLAMILGLTLLHGLCWSSIMPLTETLAVAGVRQAGVDYGRMRLWGSLSFIAASFVGGVLVGRWGADAAIWLIVSGAVAVVLAGWVLPHGPAQAGGVDASSRPAPDKTRARRLSPADIFSLMRSPSFALFLLAVSAIQSAHALFYTFGTLHWQHQGISTDWSGVLWAVGVVIEIGLFACSGAIAARLGPLGLIHIGAMASIVRWLAMALDPPLATLVGLQALHGLTYGATHLGAIHYMARHVPEAQAGTAQAILAAITSGIAMSLATLISGQLYAIFGGRAYLAMAAIAAIGFAAAAHLSHILNRRSVRR